MGLDQPNPYEQCEQSVIVVHMRPVDEKGAKERASLRDATKGGRKKQHRKR